MTVIYSAAEYETFYPYAEGGYKPKVYPERYPCLANKERVDGGIGGDYWRLAVIYLPEDPEKAKVFTEGVLATVQVLECS